MSRAYYTMFQAAQVTLEAAGLVRLERSRKALHASFNRELTHPRKLYPRELGDYLTSALTAPHAADHREAGISMRIAQRQLRRAVTFV